METPEERKMIHDSFLEEFGVEVVVRGWYNTLQGHGGEGGRTDVVVEVPDELAMTRLPTHEWHLSGRFRWADDYLAGSRSLVPTKSLGLFKKDDEDVEPKPWKPSCVLTGTDGNVFHIIGLVNLALKEAGQSERANEFTKRAFKASSYHEVLVMLNEYVNVK